VYARIVRSTVITTREADFVTASKALGESGFGILTRRIMPNSITPLIVAATLGIGGAVLEIAALAFIGVTGRHLEPGVGLDHRPREGPDLPRAAHHPDPRASRSRSRSSRSTCSGDGLRDALDPRLNR
jgi:peptide/nickel transport system permease protein